MERWRGRLAAGAGAGAAAGTAVRWSSAWMSRSARSSCSSLSRSAWTIASVLAFNLSEKALEITSNGWIACGHTELLPPGLLFGGRGADPEGRGGVVRSVRMQHNHPLFSGQIWAKLG